MNDGEIEAVGTHAELMTQDGLYKRLAQMQLVKKPLSKDVA
jgi:ABC-type multidrug transport system fused ATPase/permease subunit